MYAFVLESIQLKPGSCNNSYLVVVNTRPYGGSKIEKKTNVTPPGYFCTVQWTRTTCRSTRKKTSETPLRSLWTPRLNLRLALSITIPSTRSSPSGREVASRYAPIRSQSSSILLTIYQIYATSEERKQRNRQAQAAFRERRTEYIKQLEETIRVHETNLHSLQTAHRSAADECLMLRYKNSLLERILLEKGMSSCPWCGFHDLDLTCTGIDVQAELRAKTGSPSLGPTHAPQGMAQPPTVQRAIMNRHHQARRSNSNIAPKLETGPPVGHPGSMGNPSPQSRPTPSSHHSSPNSASPGFSQQGVMTPPGSEIQQQHQAQIQQQRAHALKQHATNGLSRPAGANGVPMKSQGSSGTGVMGGPGAAYYPSPFQNHIEQLGKLTRPFFRVSFCGTFWS